MNQKQDLIQVIIFNTIIYLHVAKLLSPSEKQQERETDGKQDNSITFS